ncbi:MAG: glycosyltransferase [Desulfarculus sp.]|nr:glycosyltransferase [Desulfarculus sp.]
MAGEPLKVWHVITSTGVGGAETQLLRLAQALGPERVAHRVACLLPLGALAGPLGATGAQVYSLNLQPGLGALTRGAKALRRLLAAWPADLVQTWMYHADLLGLLASRPLTLPLVWTLRCSDLDLSRYRRSTRLVLKACTALAHLPQPRVIVANSQSGLDFHVRLGYPRRKLRLIPNGFDTDLFAPGPAEGARRRAALGWGPDDLVVGHVARLDPAKDHAGFLTAARLLAGRLPAARFLLIGQGVEQGNPLFAACQEPPLAGRCALLGRRDDVPAWLQAMDVFAQSSLSEGLPNALGEALASGLPVAATAAGDTAALVGPAGRVVPPGQPYALAEALEQLLRLPERERQALGLLGRQRMEQGYSLAAMAGAYLELYQEMAGRPAAAGGKGPGGAAPAKE